MKSAVDAIKLMLPSKKIDAFGKDSLMFSCMPYYILAGITLLAARYSWDHSWLFVCFLYVFLPFLDEVFSLDLRNPTEQERRKLEN